MDDQLLVRAYNVGLGDCIYVRVPDKGGAKHLLIDCGNKYGTEEDLRAAIADLRQQLPKVAGQPDRRRLDLVVATHAHEDHVRGFDLDLFAGIDIDQLWLSTAMDSGHPQAEGAKALHRFALATLERLRFSPRTGLADWAGAMLALSKSAGMNALRKKLPCKTRRYVHAGSTAKQLALFAEPSTRLRVLAPMDDIDGYYLGREMAKELRGLEGKRGFRRGSAPARPAIPPAAPVQPTNVSREDFELLRRNLTDQALAFVLKEGELVNNTSVVLLLEWRGRRLLFTGDAEVKTSAQGKFQTGKANGSWNVMWEKFRKELSQPVDLLKVGHHGSFNATPWTVKKAGDQDHPVNAILDHLLPPRSGKKDKDRRLAVVSTARTNGYPTIPDPDLMMELGRRVANVGEYEESHEKEHFVPAGQPQPQRTDLERRNGARVPWIDFKLTPRT